MKNLEWSREECEYEIILRATCGPARLHVYFRPGGYTTCMQTRGMWQWNCQGLGYDRNDSVWGESASEAEALKDLADAVDRKVVEQAIQYRRKLAELRELIGESNPRSVEEAMWIQKLMSGAVT